MAGKKCMTQSVPPADYIFQCVLSVKGVLKLENQISFYLGSYVSHPQTSGYFGADVTHHYLLGFVGVLKWPITTS